VEGAPSPGRAFHKVRRIPVDTRAAGDTSLAGLYQVKLRRMLSKIYEQMGEKAKAIEHYEKFLNLWKDADPGIAEREDVRKRLAGLKGE
jgi:tetratricopeptide (TPR) repeat protein